MSPSLIVVVRVAAVDVAMAVDVVAATSKDAGRRMLCGKTSWVTIPQRQRRPWPISPRTVGWVP